MDDVNVSREAVGFEEFRRLTEKIADAVTDSAVREDERGFSVSPEILASGLAMAAYILGEVHKFDGAEALRRAADMIQALKKEGAN